MSEIKTFNLLTKNGDIVSVPVDPRLEQLRQPSMVFNQTVELELNDHSSGFRAYQDGSNRDEHQSAAWLAGFDTARKLVPNKRANRT